MIEYSRNENNLLYMSLLIIQIYILIIQSNCFKKFKSFPLLSNNNIVLITDEGIIKYEPETANTTLILPLNLITEANDPNYISFAQFPLDEGGYVFCRIKERIFIFNNNLDHLYSNFQISEISQMYCNIIPYKNLEGKNTILISFINGEEKIQILMYLINIDNNNGENATLLYSTTRLVKTDSGYEVKVLNKGISCELMNRRFYTNKLLTCFVADIQTFSIISTTFNQEDSLNFLYYSNNTIKTSGTSIIFSEIMKNNKYSIVCYVDTNQIFNFLIYSSETNKFSNKTNLLENCQVSSSNTGINFIKEENEFEIHCDTYSNEIKLIKLDENLLVKDIDNENSKCYTFLSIANENCYSVDFSYLNYFKSDNKYYVLRTCNYQNSEYLNVLDVSSCNTKTQINGLDIPNDFDFSLPSETDSSSPSETDSSSPSETDSSSPSETDSSSPSETDSSLPSETDSSLPSETDSSLPSETDSSLPSETDSSLSSESDSSLPSESDSSLQSESDSSLASESDSSLPSESDSSLQSESDSSLPSESDSYLASTSLLASFIKYKTTLKIKESSLSTKVNSIFSSTFLNLYSTSYYSTILETKSSSLISFKEKSHILSHSNDSILSTKIQYYSSTIINKNIIPKEDEIKNITFHLDNDIFHGEIKLEKEELEDKLNEIMQIIEIGQKYEINGKDYNISITPINDLNTFKSTYVDFTVCEKILRNKLNISSEEILTILQIEIDKMNENALTNQVEYAIYNEKKEKINLTVCSNVEIKIVYDIKDQSKINKTLASQYSALNIDVFNSKDSFFNDLCYPFSIVNSDIILKDRVLDIYQNYSLCDNGCEYEEFNIENMSVVCSCQIKMEINTEVPPPILKDIIQDTFKDSNFGVLRCYNLVFSLNYKLHNIGFLTFIFFVFAEIICFFLYFIFGIKSIIAFIFREMQKNNYITKIYNPKRKKKKSKSHKKLNFNPINLSNSGNEEKEKIINKNLEKDEKNNSKNKSNNKSNQPIFIFNYKFNNKIYKSNISGKKMNKNKLYKKNSEKNENSNISFMNKNMNKRRTRKLEKVKLNKEKNCPGYYNLIYINANNSSNNKPPESKYILDNYNFEEAVEYDKRDFWRIYFICLLSKENILNTFVFNSPLEIRTLRLSIFIFNYACDFALNALFYLNQKISDKYHYEGDSLYFFIFVNNITVTIFSTVFSYLLEKLLNSLTNSKESIENLFRKEEHIMRKDKKYKLNMNQKRNIFNNLMKILKILKKKIIIFIIITFLIMIFFLYFITAFCEVYKETQISWLYDSFISFLLSFPIELLISFFISILYGLAIKVRIKCLYNVVLFLYQLG